MQIEVRGQTLGRKAFWGLSQGGKLKCPDCGAIVVELHEMDDILWTGVTYACTRRDCGWDKVVDMKEPMRDR